MAELPEATVTFLLTDVVDSARLWESDFAGMRAALRRHDAAADDVVARHGGRLVKARGEGDSLFAVFARATDAVAAALALQQAYLAEPWETAAPLRVRVALNAGEVDVRGDDYYGPGVNRFAAVAGRGLAHGGQVLATQTVFDLVQEALPTGASWRALGAQALRGLERAELVYQLLHPDLPADTPPPCTGDLPPHNLPRQLTSFIGREREIEQAKALLARAPLLTLTGAGGSGKTRLALRVAEEVMAAYPDGVWFADLAPLTGPAVVARAVAAAVRMPAHPNPGAPIEEALAAHLAGKTALLLLDNCEHLLDACARLSDALLRACPSLRILATSRQSLGIAGETAWPVPTLGLPDPRRLPSVKRLGEYEAIHLFCDRAEAAHPAFALTRETAPAVARICRRLDGIPLAIELAAPRVRILSVEQIDARLDDRFRLLTGGSATALDRHRTLQATMDWSYDLLTEPERALLRRLSVFAGGCTLEAAEQVCGGEEIDEADVLELLTRLADKSLVQVEHATAGGARYALLETIRQYGAARLAERGSGDTLRDRHRDCFLELAEEAEPHLQQSDQKQWLERLEAEHDNLRAALAWSVAGDARLRMAAALWRFWYVRGYLTEGRSWLEGALSRGGSSAGGSGKDAARARALNGAGVLAMAQGGYDRARELMAECLDIRRRLADQRGLAGALNNLGLLARHQRDYDAARACYAECLEVYRRLPDPAGVAMALGNLGVVNMYAGDNDAADTLLRESLASHRKLGDDWCVAATLHNLASVAERLGKPDEARERLAEAVRLKLALGDPSALAISLESLADLEGHQGKHAQALTLMAAAQSLRAHAKVPLPPEEGLEEQKQLLSAAHAALGEAGFATAWEMGATMPVAEVIALVSPEGIDSDSDQ